MWEVYALAWIVPLASLMFVWRRFQEYFLDLVRHDLFVLRSELFEKAASNEIGIEFNSRAYRAMEQYTLALCASLPCFRYIIYVSVAR
jgi:hypothetical protein